MLPKVIQALRKVLKPVPREPVLTKGVPSGEMAPSAIEGTAPESSNPRAPYVDHRRLSAIASYQQASHPARLGQRIHKGALLDQREIASDDPVSNSPEEAAVVKPSPRPEVPQVPATQPRRAFSKPLSAGPVPETGGSLARSSEVDPI